MLLFIKKHSFEHDKIMSRLEGKGKAISLNNFGMQFFSVLHVKDDKSCKSVTVML